MLPPSHARTVLTVTSSTFAGASTLLNDKSHNQDMVEITRDTVLSVMMPAGYVGTMTEELLKLYIKIGGNYK